MDREAHRDRGAFAWGALNIETAAEFTLSLRIPAWSQGTKVEVNGQAVGGIQSGKYARLSRQWQPGDKVRAVAHTDIDLFGENRAQEMRDNLQAGAYLDVPVHFIGNLQTNKVRQVVGRAAVIHSVDRGRLLDAIARGASGVLCQQPLDGAAHGVTCVVVADTRAALTAYARHILQRLGIDGRGGATYTRIDASQQASRGVERRAQLHIGKHAVRFVDALDLLLGLMMMLRIAPVAIRVKRQRQKSIALPDLIIRSQRRDAEHFIVIRLM